MYNSSNRIQAYLTTDRIRRMKAQGRMGNIAMQRMERSMCFPVQGSLCYNSIKYSQGSRFDASISSHVFRALLRHILSPACVNVDFMKRNAARVNENQKLDTWR